MDQRHHSENPQDPAQPLNMLHVLHQESPPTGPSLTPTAPSLEPVSGSEAASYPSIDWYKYRMENALPVDDDMLPGFTSWSHSSHQASQSGQGDVDSPLSHD